MNTTAKSRGNTAVGAHLSSPNLQTETLNGEDRNGRSTLVSRNITVLGRRTSVRLEPEMWTALRDIARRENCRIHDLCSLIQMRKNPRTSLTAAIRVFLMLYFRAASTDEGHARVGHGNFNTMLGRARLTRDQIIGVRNLPLPGDNVLHNFIHTQPMPDARI